MSWMSRSGLKRTELTPAEKVIGIIRLSTESLQHLSLVTEEETGERRLHLDCQSAGDWTVAALAWTVQCTVHCTLYCTVSSNTHLHSTVYSPLDSTREQSEISINYCSSYYQTSSIAIFRALPSLFPSWTLVHIKLLTIVAKHLISTLKQMIDKELGQRNSRTWIAMYTDL